MIKISSQLFVQLFFAVVLSSCDFVSAQNQGSITQISLERTRCFGTCPVYKVAIHADGLVEFHGELFVAAIGDYTATVAAENFETLAEFAEQIDFSNLDEEYRFGRTEDGSIIAVSDLPSRITTIYRGEDAKSILNYYNGPEVLEQFELLIDELTDSVGWVGSQTPGF